jgi:hypothetical protein
MRRNTVKQFGRGATAAAAIAMASLSFHAGAAERTYKDREYNVQDGVLKWGKQDAKFTAIHVPDLAHPDTGAPDIARKLNAVAKVGGQAIAYDLHGFNEKGTAITEEALQQFRDVRHQHDWRRMNAICRIFGDDAPDDPQWRKRAAKTAAKAIKDELKVVYWIDGPNAGELIQVFKRNAPDLVVAAFDGGDVHLVGEGDELEPDVTNIYVNNAQPQIDSGLQIVLPAGQESYEALERASVEPVEKEPWEPDNSNLSEEERAEGFIALFDGKTLNGWHPKDGGGVFVVEDGMITRIGGEWSQLRTRDRYDNFILRLEWRMVDGGNSGVFIRAPRNARYSKIGMEFQLLNDGNTEPSDKGMGALYEAQAPLKVVRSAPMEWNTLEIKADGPHIQAWSNGELVQDVNCDEHEELQSRLREGFIALQDHDHRVQFRNVRLKKL